MLGSPDTPEDFIRFLTANCPRRAMGGGGSSVLLNLAGCRRIMGMMRIKATLVAIVSLLTVAVGVTSASAVSGGYSYAGTQQFLTATQAAGTDGISARVQAWSVSTQNFGGGNCTHSLGELAIQGGTSTTITRDVVIEVGYRNYCGLGPRLFAGVWRNGTFLGYNAEFTACTTAGVNGCVNPAWIPLGNALTSGGQYTMKLQYTHVGLASEGWWVYVQGSGACPSGTQCWLGYFRKSIWANAAAPANAGWYGVDTPWVQVFGEVYDNAAAGSRCTNMGTGALPTSTTGALFDQYALIGSSAGAEDLDQFNTDSDPLIYNSTARTNTSFRYGGPGDC